MNAEEVCWGQGMTSQEWEKQYLEAKHGQVPVRCPRCSGDRIVRLFWGERNGACGPYRSAIACGQGILVTIKRPPGGRTWGCLSCEPEWATVHGLAMQDYHLQLQKEQSIANADFPTAIKYQNQQEDLLKQQSAVVNRLLSSDPPS